MATSDDSGAVDIQAQSHPAQERFIRDTNDETAYIGGVGSGKTAAGILRVGRHVAEWNPGEMGVIVAPTVPMMNNAILPELRKWGLLDRDGIDHNRSQNRIEYPNGSVVVLETANNDRKIERLRAMNLAWAWIDEAAYVPGKVYNILSDRLRVGQYRNLFATTTPRGFNWVYDTFADIDADPEPAGDGQLLVTDTTTTITGTSTRSNPAHPEDYIERQERQRSGEAYQQEIEGEFVNFEGLVYQWFGDEHKVDADDMPDTFDETIYGLDWGGSAPTAIICLRRSGEDWYAVAEFYERRVVNDTIVAELERMESEYTPGPIYCDTNEPRAIDRLSRDGFNAKEAEKSVETGIRHIDSLRENLHVVETCQHLINEFNQYRYKDGSDDVLKENDHLMDALRYALFSNDSALEAGGEVIEW
jgi:PBSX family phage terminase large subunit